MSRFATFGSLLMFLVCSGCDKSPDKSAANQPAANQPAVDYKKDDKGIFNKFTQEVGRFDPNKADQVVSDHKINATDPITAGLSGYGPGMEKVANIGVTQALNFFYVENERYPATYEEFMEKIIKGQNIRLPVLPYQGRYEYDVENHELKEVYTREQAAKRDGTK